MANEISCRINLSISNGNLIENINESYSANQSVARGPLPGSQLIGTTEEVLVLTDLGTPGVAIFKNLDTANYVQLGLVVAGTFYPFVKLKAGESCLFRVDPTAVIYARADVAPVFLQAKVFSD